MGNPVAFMTLGDSEVIDKYKLMIYFRRESLPQFIWKRGEEVDGRPRYSPTVRGNDIVLVANPAGRYRCSPGNGRGTKAFFTIRIDRAVLGRSADLGRNYSLIPVNYRVVEPPASGAGDITLIDAFLELGRVMNMAEGIEEKRPVSDDLLPLAKLVQHAKPPSEEIDEVLYKDEHWVLEHLSAMKREIAKLIRYRPDLVLTVNASESGVQFKIGRRVYQELDL